MERLKKLSKPLKIALMTGLILLGTTLILLAQIKPYSLFVNGEQIELKAAAFSARKLFGLAQIELKPEDRLSVHQDKFSLSLPRTIELTQARNVLVKRGEMEHISFSAELLPANLLTEAGIRIYPRDLLLLDQKPIPVDQPLTPGLDVVLEVVPAKQVDLYYDGVYATSIFTQAESFLEAIEEASPPFHPLDDFSPNLESPLQAQNRLDITRARQVCLRIKTDISCKLTPAETVAQAMVDLGMTAQFLNTTDVEELADIDEMLDIRLSEVIERVSLTKDESLFGYTYQADPEAELDTTSVLIAGRPGIVVSRATERFVDGELVATVTEKEWQASQEADAILGYGTRASLKTELVDGQQLEYWRKVSVYATSYHPGEFDRPAVTRSGLPLTKGIVAVSAAWYPSMAMQRVYVPGYGFGTVADSGGGIPGRYWVDLGYDDSNYVGWHDWTSLYFLAPIPANYLGVLP